eukprot:3404337-Rhodomonas_salina.2
MRVRVKLRCEAAVFHQRTQNDHQRTQRLVPSHATQHTTHQHTNTPTHHHTNTTPQQHNMPDLTSPAGVLGKNEVSMPHVPSPRGTGAVLKLPPHFIYASSE